MIFKLFDEKKLQGKLSGMSVASIEQQVSELSPENILKSFE